MTPLKRQHHDFLAKVHKSQGILYRICAVYTHDQEDRNDLWQEILLQLWRSFPSFKYQSSFSTWMYRVALNTALMHQRRRNRRWFSSSLENKDLTISENCTEYKYDQVELLYQCIHELSYLDKAIILLKLEQKIYREIAEITGLSESNISVRIVRIKAKLKQMLLKKGVQGE